MGLIKSSLQQIGQAADNMAKGIINNALQTAGGVINDNLYLEYFICDAFQDNVLAVKGEKRDKKGHNKGNDNIISNGSGLRFIFCVIALTFHKHF